VATIDRVLVAAGVRECDCYKCTGLVTAAKSVARKGITELNRGDVLCMGAFRLEVVWPNTFQDQGGNADSLCLLAQADCDDDGTVDCTALLTGDAESEQLDQMLAAGLVGAVDLFKVGHHGSKASVTAKQLRMLCPKACLVSVGEGNRYGHPSSQVMEALRNTGARVLRTDLQGDLICVLRPDGLYLRTQYSDAP
ncbi:MAG: DNA internalization-related competence protein ComEC/Rec2, partial [Eggerthellales bacterium]|nr:DNA internalization-related competence protein ComEC/Rec2 [Eggerthellales bacterium]